MYKKCAYIYPKIFTFRSKGFLKTVQIMGNINTSINSEWWYFIYWRVFFLNATFCLNHLIYKSDDLSFKTGQLYTMAGCITWEIDTKLSSSSKMANATSSTLPFQHLDHLLIMTDKCLIFTSQILFISPRRFFHLSHSRHNVNLLEDVNFRFKFRKVFLKLKKHPSSLEKKLSC